LKQKQILKEDALQRKERLTKLVVAADKAKQQLGMTPAPADVNKDKWKGVM
tara:strand:+ start:320 stop:472 length:153 start_codon:yes stop_codon:yes gene_type:complete